MLPLQASSYTQYQSVSVPSSASQQDVSSDTDSPDGRRLSRGLHSLGYLAHRLIPLSVMRDEIRNVREGSSVEDVETSLSEDYEVFHLREEERVWEIERVNERVCGMKRVYLSSCRACTDNILSRGTLRRFRHSNEKVSRVSEHYLKRRR